MLPERRLGKAGPRVGAIGYGAMVLGGTYGAADEGEAIATLERALEGGCNLIDTADAYAGGRNETLVGRAIKGRRRDAVIATKCGIVRGPDAPGSDFPTGWGFTLRINGRPEYIRRALDQSLVRLKVDEVDLFYLHYPDPDVPIVESVGALADAVRAGKTLAVGLSNVTPADLRLAHAVYPIAAVQYEYSLWRREPEAELLPLARELGVGFVPWAPLGSGFLTGTVESVGADDFRRHNPKFAPANLEANRDRFAPLAALAASLGITAAQLALAWLLHQGDAVVP
ncbi:MAG TPA: aldo/keto reductase, partial [Candidatus Polarisedimenticolia bacterium]|nr:aldo/keto reductase [Candidatus Polarisedimenticolia bacterium]